jgi:ankyrin repeat protein
MRAALGGDGAIVDQLLGAGANVNQADTNGWTALICAAAGDAAIVKRLMGAGADIKRSAKDGTTALKRATATGHTVVAETLEAEMRLRAELG